MVLSWLSVHDSAGLSRTYERLIGPARLVVPFQVIAELRFGALHASWGRKRTLSLDRELSQLETAHTDDLANTTYAQLRDTCRRIGNPLWQKIHDGDRWIAALALRLGLPLVSHDAIYRGVPGLTVLTAGGD